MPDGCQTVSQKRVRMSPTEDEDILLKRLGFILELLVQFLELSFAEIKQERRV